MTLTGIFVLEWTAGAKLKWSTSKEVAFWIGKEWSLELLVTSMVLDGTCHEVDLFPQQTFSSNIAMRDFKFKFSLVNLHTSCLLLWAI